MFLSECAVFWSLKFKKTFKGISIFAWNNNDKYFLFTFFLLGNLTVLGMSGARSHVHAFTDSWNFKNYIPYILIMSFRFVVYRTSQFKKFSNVNITKKVSKKKKTLSSTLFVSPEWKHLFIFETHKKKLQKKV